MNLEPEPFTTARLDALPLRVAYADEMAAVLGDPALHTYTGGAPETADELRARYGRQTAGSPDPGVRWWNWVLRVRDEGRLAGYVQATVDVPGAEAEIAWVVGTRWQGRGYAKEAAEGLVAHLLAGAGTGTGTGAGTGVGTGVVRTVLAHIHPDHDASAAVAGAAGLVPTEEWCDGERRWERGAGED
ncbi:GNAT family N-acetyltransferase [Streptomyces sp. NBC_00825]|uniref:GNAT family N-acetyltransferase n=1 Tax=unclassified Streptomyces TaxID=2593676 RepID=UPI002ED45A55|nr:GNAT family N-acetyltransferase [Streptomyces sp. NBC_00826]WTH91181.1 GNAT family N-acetyltransferase [Streptomyces sp. NBC_00825]WTH99907.1 GNAT family N-acetyltransferase [Streptomyces sp. NBC_00822]